MRLYTLQPRLSKKMGSCLQRGLSCQMWEQAILPKKQPIDAVGAMRSSKVVHSNCVHIQLITDIANKERQRMEHPRLHHTP